MACWLILLYFSTSIVAVRAARSVELQLLEQQTVARVQVSYRVVVNEAQEWSDADMQVCIWRAFTSPAATPYTRGSIQAAECYSGASGVASISATEAGTYVIKAVIVRRGIAQFDSTEAMSETAILSVTVNEQLQIDLNGLDYNDDERMQRLQQSLQSMRSTLMQHYSDPPDLSIHVNDTNDTALSLLLLDTNVNPYLLRTHEKWQPLLESECSITTCTAQLTALRQHSRWKKVKPLIHFVCSVCLSFIPDLQCSLADDKRFVYMHY
jgi:hypothetical protein